MSDVGVSHCFLRIVFVTLNSGPSLLLLIGQTNQSYPSPAPYICLSPTKPPCGFISIFCVRFILKLCSVPHLWVTRHTWLLMIFLLWAHSLDEYRWASVCQSGSRVLCPVRCGRTYADSALSSVTMTFVCSNWDAWGADAVLPKLDWSVCEHKE